MRTTTYALSLLTLTLAARDASAQTIQITDYWPLAHGYSWQGVALNCQAPCSPLTYDVLQQTVPQAPGGLRVGPDPDNCFVLENTGAEFKIHGFLDNGTYYPTTPVSPVVMENSLLLDGSSFQVEDTIWVVVRDWTLVDPNNGYGVPHNVPTVAWVWYDTNFSGGNQHHAVLESNLPPGTVLPGGNVTDVEWFVEDVGPAFYMDVGAGTGLPWPPALDWRYEASFDCNGNGEVDRNDDDLNMNGIPDDCECVNYCSSFPNATGSAAVLSCTGDPGSSLVVTSTPVPNTPGQFFYGPMSLMGSPFGDGLLCVGGAITRIQPFIQAGMMMQPANTAVLTVDYAAPYATGLIGTQNFQHWFRSGLMTGSGSNTSDAVSIVF